jgi:hypothetical protein
LVVAGQSLSLVDGYLPLSVDGEVMRVPRLYIVINGVLLLAIPLANIVERIVQTIMISTFT